MLATASLGDDATTGAQARTRVVLELAELLQKKLKPGMASIVFRRPAAVFDGSSMLEMVRAGREVEVLASARRSFDWSGTA